MYVRKFEADSLEEALGNIKRELGPDAIILKTLTNKGLKGAFKKKKIEITAAISEKNYSKKSNVDEVLTSQQKDKFYKGNSSYISNMIDSNSNNKDLIKPAISSYGKLGLNRQVSAENLPGSPLAQGSSSASSLDDFLKEDISPKAEPSFASALLEKELEASVPNIEEASVYRSVQTPVVQETTQAVTSVIDSKITQVIELQKNKIDDLEKMLFELTQSVQNLNKPESLGVQELVSILRSLDIAETYVQKIIRKANFELSVSEREDPDAVFELALREMLSEINVGMPLFSSVDNSVKNTVTVLISDVTTGQSTMLRKIASLQKDAMIIRNKGTEDFKDNSTFSEKFFNIDVKTCRTISEIVAEVRGGLDGKRNVFVDYKAGNQEVNEVKKFIDGLRRSFENVEVLVCLSSINTELYNRKILNRYSSLSNGMVVTHLDECLNFGGLFNLATDFNSLPYKFFGTGQVVPDDLESATAERILAGIFQL